MSKYSHILTYEFLGTQISLLQPSPFVDSCCLRALWFTVWKTAWTTEKASDHTALYFLKESLPQTKKEVEESWDLHPFMHTTLLERDPSFMHDQDLGHFPEF